MTVLCCCVTAKKFKGPFSQVHIVLLIHFYCAVLITNNGEARTHTHTHKKFKTDTRNTGMSSLGIDMIHFYKLRFHDPTSKVCDCKSGRIEILTPH